MKQMIRIFGLLSILLTCGVSYGEVINFDDITTDPFDPVPANYGGLQFVGSWFVESDADYSSTWGNSYGAPSSSYAAFNGFGSQNISITTADDSTFDFTGASFASWANNDGFTAQSAQNLTIVGLLNGSQVASEVIALAADQYNFVPLVGFEGIDELVFSPFQVRRAFMIDDINVTLNPTPGGDPVPEPASIAVWGLLAGGLVVWRRRVS